MKLIFEERYETAKEIQTICNKWSATLVVNNDHRIAELIGCGLHIGQDIEDTSFLKEAKNISFVGLSCKNKPEQQAREDSELFSYYSFGPFFESKTKKNITGPIDIFDVSSKMDKEKINIAIGGISEINLRLIKQNKFNMAAICDGIYNDLKKIEVNCRKLIEIWNEN
jgi:Thiamine monophosphate synthase